MSTSSDRHDRLTRELNEERAAALFRISRTLESLIDQLNAARAAMAGLDDLKRHRSVVRYRELRKEALRYRWYLEVQREAIGLRQHHHLDEFYAIPPAL